MKKPSLLAALMLASGCHGGAHAPQAYRAIVSAEGGRLCISLPETRPGENLRSLNVEDATGALQRQLLSYPWQPSQYQPAVAGQCVPLLGYAFEAGHRYNLAVTVAVPDAQASNGVDRGRFFSASFKLLGKPGAWQVESEGR